MPPRSTKNSLHDPEDLAMPNPNLQEPSMSAHIKEVTQDDSPDDLTVDPTPNLAEAIVLMTNELRHRDTPSKTVNTAVKQPDTFDGSDPKKLNNFILLCNLYFWNNPAYADGRSKITFALTLLRGTALKFFEPLLMTNEALAWEDDWEEFTKLLCSQFGPLDPTADAADCIDNLKMKDNQCILKYNIEFTHLATLTGWDDSVLWHRYYSGLADRIKDIMGQQGKPDTLDKMKVMSHSIDARHWECVREKSRSGPNKSNNSNNSSNSNKSDKKSNSTPSTPNSSNKTPTKSPNNNKDNKNNKLKSIPSPLADKLGKDGKLTPQERQCCFDNNLCMFCGALGHTATNCTKASSSASKAWACATQASESKEEPKK